MNVSLTPELERLVNEKVESGLYQTASEVVREALRLLKDRDQAREQLRADVQAGFDQLARGEGANLRQGFGPPAGRTDQVERSCGSCTRSRRCPIACPLLPSRTSRRSGPTLRRMLALTPLTDSSIRSSSGSIF